MTDMKLELLQTRRRTLFRANNDGPNFVVLSADARTEKKARSNGETLLRARIFDQPAVDLSEAEGQARRPGTHLHARISIIGAGPSVQVVH